MELVKQMREGQRSQTEITEPEISNNTLGNPWLEERGRRFRGSQAT